MPKASKNNATHRKYAFYRAFDNVATKRGLPPAPPTDAPDYVHGLHEQQLRGQQSARPFEALTYNPFLDHLRQWEPEITPEIRVVLRARDVLLKVTHPDGSVFRGRAFAVGNEWRGGNVIEGSDVDTNTVFTCRHRETAIGRLIVRAVEKL